MYSFVLLCLFSTYTLFVKFVLFTFFVFCFFVFLFFLTPVFFTILELLTLHLWHTPPFQNPENIIPQSPRSGETSPISPWINGWLSLLSHHLLATPHLPITLLNKYREHQHFQVPPFRLWKWHVPIPHHHFLFFNRYHSIQGYSATDMYGFT